MGWKLLCSHDVAGTQLCAPAGFAVASRQVLCDDGPILGTMLGHKVPQLLILLQVIDSEQHSDPPMQVPRHVSAVLNEMGSVLCMCCGPCMPATAAKPTAAANTKVREQHRAHTPAASTGCTTRAAALTGRLPNLCHGCRWLLLHLQWKCCTWADSPSCPQGLCWLSCPLLLSCPRHVRATAPSRATHWCCSPLRLPW